MQTTKTSVKRVLALLSILVLSLVTLTTVFANEVTQYTLNTEVKVDGKPLTADTKITTGRVLEATNSLTFPDSQAINAGDTLTLDLPKELELVTKLEFPILNPDGQKVGDGADFDWSISIFFVENLSRSSVHSHCTLSGNVEIICCNLAGRHSDQN